MTANVNSWLLKFINPWFFGKDFLKKEIKLLARKLNVALLVPSI